MRHRYASGAFIPRILLAAHRMAITDRTGLWMECLSAPGPGTTFITFTPRTIVRFTSTVDLASGRALIGSTALSGSTAIGLIDLTGLIMIADSMVSTERALTMTADLTVTEVLIVIVDSAGLIATGDLIEAASLMRHEGSAETIAALEALTAATVAREE
jgi:hypothetical protein